jgi:hypothetical protein
MGLCSCRFTRSAKSDKSRACALFSSYRYRYKARETTIETPAKAWHSAVTHSKRPPDVVPVPQPLLDPIPRLGIPPFLGHQLLHVPAELLLQPLRQGEVVLVLLSSFIEPLLVPAWLWAGAGGSGHDAVRWSVVRWVVSVECR